MYTNSTFIKRTLEYIDYKFDSDSHYSLLNKNNINQNIITKNKLNHYSKTVNTIKNKAIEKDQKV